MERVRSDFMWFKASAARVFLRVRAEHRVEHPRFDMKSSVALTAVNVRNPVSGGWFSRTNLADFPEQQLVHALQAAGDHGRGFTTFGLVFRC
jgi:hypothetical protein